MDRSVLDQVLLQIDGCAFAGISTFTRVKLSGGVKNPMQNRVDKLSTGNNVMLFTNKKSNAYEAMVKRRLEKEGKNPDDFQLKPRKWGTRIAESPYVEHNGELYLEVIFNHAGKSTYFYDGKPIKKEDIVGLDDKEPTGQGGLVDQVQIRTFKLSSIVEVVYGKQTYK